MTTSASYIKIKNNLLDLEQGVVMGILNVTPDSFYAASRISSNQITDCVGKMLADGAKIIDIGGYSTRPYAPEVSETEEIDRVLFAVETVVKHFPDVCISVDTFRSKVAEKTILAGASLINDVSGGQADSQMFEIVAKYKVPYVLMHSRGNPQTMSNLTHYNNIIEELLFFFNERITRLHALGCYDIIVDVGFGFAKTIEQNYYLLNHLKDFDLLNKPILVGISRKSMLWKPLQTSPDQVLHGTSALHLQALQRGAKILRVHDVKPAVEIMQLYSLLQSAE